MCLRDPVCNLWASQPSRLLCIFSLWALSRLSYRWVFLNFSPSLGRIISCNCGLGVREAVKIIKCFLRCKVPALSGPFHSEKDARDAIRVSTTQLSRPTFTMNWPRDAAGLTEHWMGNERGSRQRVRFYLWLYLSLCLCEIFVYVTSFPGNLPRFFPLLRLWVRSNRLAWISGPNPFVGPNHVPWFAVIIPQSVLRLRARIRMWLNLIYEIDEHSGLY